MRYELFSKGFATETLSIKIEPSIDKADEVYVQICTNLKEEFEDEEFIPQISGALHVAKKLRFSCFYDQEVERYIEGVWHIHIPAEKTEKLLEELNAEFFSFHHKQNDEAKQTINLIRNLRVEELVPELGWEITKTSTRRGTRR